MPASTENTVKITNVSPGDCIPLNFSVRVSYTNANGVGGTVAVACDGVAAMPSSSPAIGPSGVLSFAISHAAAASNHTVTATLTHPGSVATDSVAAVGVGNPCPIIIGGIDGMFEGLPAINPANALGGTFDTSKGNRVVVLVEEPVYVNGQLMQPRLDFANPAEVNKEKAPPNTGTWKHPAIPGAKKSQHVRVVLTKDGEVKAVAHAIFK
jgi:hypothetical protein